MRVPPCVLSHIVSHVSSQLRNHRNPLILLLLSLAFWWTASGAAAAWPSDPGVNLAIGNGAGEDVVPKIAGSPDGSCYVGWFDNSSGNYNVRLQRLDAAGNEQWPHNGILVSAHAQDTWITDWDLICDAQGNCVLTFSDIRSGNLDVQGYKITAAGLFPWGPDGINLSQNAAFEPTPAVCQASDGDYVFAWSRLPDVGAGMMMMQRVSPEGTLRYAAGGIPVVSPATEDPAFPDLEPSLNGDVLLMYVRDISSYMSPRHIRLQRFTPAGAPVWPTFTAIYDGAAVPLGYAPHIRSDGAGGAVCGWHSAPVNTFSSYVQRVLATGAEVFAHNGVLVSTDATRHHIDPATAFNAATGEIFVFWNERNSNQDQWGIYGQRISAAGARLWGATGIVLQPVNTVYKSYPRSAALGDGAVCSFTDTPAGFSGDRLVAYRLDASGANVWPTVPVLVSTVQSDKSRLPFFMDTAGITRIAWEDTRNGTPDVYAQNLNPDGTIGGNPASAPDLGLAVSAARNVPNPFRGSTEIVFRAVGLAPGIITIFAPDGRVVRRAELGLLGTNSASWLWDGRDDEGRELPAGVYTYRCAFGNEGRSSGKAVLIR